MYTTNPVYHAQANTTEKVKRVLQTMIVAFLQKNHKDRDVNVHEFMFAFNTPVHGALKVLPTFLNFEREPLPYRNLRREYEKNSELTETKSEEWLDRVSRLIHLRDLVCKNLDRSYETQEKYYNEKKRNLSLRVGDLVLKRDRKKFDEAKDLAQKLNEKFIGPFKISRRMSPVVYCLVSIMGKNVPKTDYMAPLEEDPLSDKDIYNEVRWMTLLRYEARL